MGDVAESASVPAPQQDFTVWVRPHLVAMAALAARLTSPADRDDVVQESLAAAWRKFGQYDPRRGRPSTWLLAIVADQARKSRRRRRHPPLSADPSYTDHLADLDVERAVARLPRRQRLSAARYYFLDLPVSEVAAVMGCSTGTVKATLAHARTALRDQLREDL